MSTSKKNLLALLAIALIAGVLAGRSHAANRTWIGGNTTWSDNTGNANWAPVADEPDPDDVAIFNTANTGTLGSANTVMGLTMSGGIELWTNGHDLTVNGLVQLVDADTDFVVNGVGSALSADNVTINSGEVRLNDGTLTVVEETGNGVLDINAGGTLSGNGTVNMADLVAAGTLLIFNDGTITASSPPLVIGGPPPIGTLALNASDDADARINLDGSGSENGVVNVSHNQTLEVNITLWDDFDSAINLGHNSTLDIAGPWTLGSGGTIDVYNGFVPGVPGLFPTIPADVSFISGGAFTHSGGTITVGEADGTLQFNAPFTQTGGTVTNNGLVVFNNDATIGAGANFDMAGWDASLTVNAGVTVNVDQANFSADHLGGLTNIITVNSGGVLDLDLGAGAVEDFNGPIHLNGGELDVTTTDGVWSIRQRLNMVHVGGNTPTVAGNAVEVGDDVGSLDADIEVSGGGASVIQTAVTFFSDADVEIAAGATLELDGSATFNSVSGANSAQFTGGGVLELDGASNVVNEAMTINMPGGRVDLDGSGVLSQTLTLGGMNGDLTLNVAGIDSADNSFGKSVLFGGDTIVLNQFSSLIVNLTNPIAEWTLNSTATLDINAALGVGGSGIQGSDFNMAGTADISGNSVWNARTDISGTVNVALFGSLNLRGGDLTDANVNRLEGGTITGDGALSALVDEGLFGFGTIETNIDFNNNTELRADNGTLTVNAPIGDVGVIGTADTNGILNVVSNWSTAAADLVELRGGQITGGSISNVVGKTIRGHGTIASQSLSNGGLIAGDGGTLTINTVANPDLDGLFAISGGDLEAIAGDISVVDPLADSFGSEVTVGAGRTITFQSGWTLGDAGGGTLNLNGGTTLANRAAIAGATQTLQGIVNVDKMGQFDAPTTFGASVTVNLNDADDTLRNSANSVVLNGATFSGSGSLLNLAGRQLNLAAGSDVGVLVENEGILEIAASAVGRADLSDFQQSANGVIIVDLGGTGLNDFDRLVIDGAAQLNGRLDIFLFGPFTPALGNMFSIISATGGVTGTFTAVNQPATMPAGLLFDVVYTATAVQLHVVNAPIFTADFDEDGDVDGDDLTEWRGDFGVNGDSDADNDGDSDGADFLAWQQQLGSGAPATSASAAVPEPSAALAALSAMAALVMRRQLRSRCKWAP